VVARPGGGPWVSRPPSRTILGHSRSGLISRLVEPAPAIAPANTAPNEPTPEKSPERCTLSTRGWPLHRSPLSCRSPPGDRRTGGEPEPRLFPLISPGQRRATRPSLSSLRNGQTDHLPVIKAATLWLPRPLARAVADSVGRTAIRTGSSASTFPGTRRPKITRWDRTQASGLFDTRRSRNCPGSSRVLPSCRRRTPARRSDPGPHRVPTVRWWTATRSPPPPRPLR